MAKYTLYNFFLYYFHRNGFDAHKIKALAGRASPELTEEEIETTLTVFYRRFYSQQFKRSCMLDRPNVGTGIIIFTGRLEDAI